MAALSDLRSYTQVLLNDQGTRVLTAAQVDSLIMRSLEEWCNDTEELWREQAYAVVAKQMYYTAPTDMIRLVAARFGQTGYSSLEVVNAHEFQAHRAYDYNYGPATPAIIMVENQGVAPIFRIWPPPTTASATTTLSAAITDTAAVSISAVTPSTSFRSPAGWMSIDSEKIIFQNSSTTQFLLCRRGEAGTTAATHLDAATVTQLDLMISYIRQPTALSANGDIPEINVQHHYYLCYGAAARALSLDGRDPGWFQNEWLRLKHKAKLELSRRRSAAPASIMPEY